MLILDEINMPIDEFMYAVHDFHRDDLNELLSKIQLFVSTHDIDGLKKLLNSQLESEPKREKFHHINTILLKILEYVDKYLQMGINILTIVRFLFASHIYLW